MFRSILTAVLSGVFVAVIATLAGIGVSVIIDRIAPTPSSCERL